MLTDNLVSNDVTSIGLFHKMGQRSTPAIHLAFGAKDDCFGYLIGEEGKGLAYMFQMMNTARLGVGLAGTYIASAAYYASLQYAKERPQGRKLNNKNVNRSTNHHHSSSGCTTNVVFAKSICRRFTVAGYAML